MISVVIPMYNSRDTIENAVNSVINQTYHDKIEIIVVNDGSEDGCEKLIEKIISKNLENRHVKLINQKNLGVSNARNRGINEAKGIWIALLDSDDVWLPEKLDKQVEAINSNSRIQFIGTNRNGELYPFFQKSKQVLYSLNAKEIIAKWHPHTSTALIKKEALLKAGLYDKSRTHAEDGDLWLKIAQYCELYVLNEDLVYTGGGKRSFGESGLSANMPKMYEGEILALKGARYRKQISRLEYLLFYFWLSIKYCRRVAIVGLTK